MKFLHYIQHSLKGKEAHRIELEAMKDPFLAESLEGYELVKGHHDENIKFLQKRLFRQRNAKPTRLQWNIIPWYVTATVMLCVGIGGYFMVQPSKKAPQSPQETIQPIDSLSKQDSIPLNL